jgi:hypothetical protein
MDRLEVSDVMVNIGLPDAGGLFFAGSILIYKGRYEAILCKRQDVDFCSTTENVEARG